MALALDVLYLKDEFEKIKQENEILKVIIDNLRQENKKINATLEKKENSYKISG